jgi:deoxyribonuclease V
MMTAEFSVKRARKAQKTLAQKVVTEDRLPPEIKLVAGAVAVLDYETLKVLETQTATQAAKFPYVPTLLSFREFPVVAPAVRKLRLQPDVFLADAHGRAHPFRCGFACHLGLALRKPTIGVAKSRLIGEAQQADEEVVLVHEGEVVGAVVHTQKDQKPVFVSVGHMVSLETAVKIVKHCTTSSRIPEPILQAHRTATNERKNLIAATTHR